MIPVTLEHLREQLLDTISIPTFKKSTSDNQDHNNQQAKTQSNEENSTAIVPPSPYREEKCCCENSMNSRVSTKSPKKSDHATETLLSRRNSRIQKTIDEMFTGSVTSITDLSKKPDMLPTNNEYSKGDSYDFTRVKSTYTSKVRCKLARNEPFISQYYEEHMERFGKPPFVWEMRNSTL